MSEFFHSVPESQIGEHKEAWEKLFSAYSFLVGVVPSDAELAKDALIQLPNGRMVMIEESVKIGSKRFEKPGDVALIYVTFSDSQDRTLCEATGIIEKNDNKNLLKKVAYKGNKDLGLGTDQIKNFIQGLSEVLS